MAVQDMYPLEFLNDLLLTKKAVTMSIQRNDEMSGSGDGRYWVAEMAPPLWTAQLTLDSLNKRSIGRARGIDAKFRALGVNRTFLFADPSYAGPASGASVALAASSVLVSAVGSGRTTLSFSGFPPGFALSAGDRFSTEYASGRYYLAELTEDATASASGAVASVAVYPYPPLTLAAGVAADFVRPVMRAFVPPGGYTPFNYIRDFAAQGASVTILQRR